MIQRFYSVDENLNLDWVDIDPIEIIQGDQICFWVTWSKDANIDFRFWKSWINSKDSPDGVWFRTPQNLAIYLKKKAKEIENTPVHIF